jgi:hypothetical protein
MSLAENLKSAVVREVPVELELETEKVKVTVRYKLLSVKAVRQQRELFKTKEAAGETVYLSETLENRVVSLVEENGDVIPVNIDLLENMTAENLSAIQTAIDGATDPK